MLNRSSAIDIPDFTAGAWKTNPRNMDINFEDGGGNTDLLPPVEPATDVDDALARQWAQDHG